MPGFAKVRLEDLKAAVIGAGVEISLKLAGVHRGTNKLFMTVSAKKAGLFGGQEIFGTCHDLDSWFVDLDISPRGLELLNKWGIPYQLSDKGF